MIIQVMLYGFIAYFALLIISGIYFFWLDFLFRSEIKQTNPTAAEVVRLWQEANNNQKNPIDQVGLSGKRLNLYKILKKSFPTGISSLDEKFANRTRVLKRIAIAFAGLLVYAAVFIVVLIKFYNGVS